MGIFIKKHRKKWAPTEDNYLVDFSFTNIDKNMIRNLLYHLYKEYGINNLTYLVRNCRYYIYCQTKPTKEMKQFFKNHTAEQVKDLCFKFKETKIMCYLTYQLDNGFLDYDIKGWKEIK